MSSVLFLDDLRHAARRQLPKCIFDYIDGGAGRESGLMSDRDALDRIFFVPRRLADVSRRKLSTDFFGKNYSMPLAIAPMGLCGAISPKADIILARAAERAGIPFILSTASTSALEDVARVSDGERWFQLYVLDRDLAMSLLRRAQAARYSTLVVTVDVPVGGMRMRDLKNGFSIPLKLQPRILFDLLQHPGWLLQQLVHGFPQLANLHAPAHKDLSRQAALMQRSMDASFSWDGLKVIRDNWKGKLIVKGILHPEDLRRAESTGVDAIVVSTHGGRQLDDALPAVESLKLLSEQARIPVLFDSGIRSGADAIKVKALGARMVLIGRPLLYALAAGGGSFVDAALSKFRDEMDNTLAQLGSADIDSLSKDYLKIS